MVACERYAETPFCARQNLSSYLATFSKNKNHDVILMVTASWTVVLFCMTTHVISLSEGDRKQDALNETCFFLWKRTKTGWYKRSMFCSRLSIDGALFCFKFSKRTHRH
jgi:hypothetical protein